MKRLHAGWVLLLGAAMFSCTPEETPVPRAKELRHTAPEIALIPVNYQILDTLTTVEPGNGGWRTVTNKDFRLYKEQLNMDGSFGHSSTINNLQIPVPPSAAEMVLRADGMSCPDQLLSQLPAWQGQANKQCQTVIGHLPCSIGEKAVTLVIGVFPMGCMPDPELNPYEPQLTEVF